MRAARLSLAAVMATRCGRPSTIPLRTRSGPCNRSRLPTGYRDAFPQERVSHTERSAGRPARIRSRLSTPDRAALVEPDGPLHVLYGGGRAGGRVIEVAAVGRRDPAPV